MPQRSKWKHQHGLKHFMSLLIRYSGQHLFILVHCPTRAESHEKHLSMRQ